MKRALNVAQGVEAAIMVRELNTREDKVRPFLTSAGINPGDGKSVIFLEWFAFVHAAVLYGLMEHSPNIVVVEYLRTTRTTLESMGLTGEEASAFVDGPLQRYVEPLLQHDTRRCPSIFFENALKSTMESQPAHSVAVISGGMAMVMAAILDTFEKFEFLAEMPPEPEVSPS